MLEVQVRGFLRVFERREVAEVPCGVPESAARVVEARRCLKNERERHKNTVRCVLDLQATGGGGDGVQMRSKVAHFDGRGPRVSNLPKNTWSLGNSNP